MKTLTQKLVKAVTHPELWPSYGIMILKSAQVSKVTQNGQVFYKYKGELYPAYLNEGNASSNIMDKALVYCQGQGIDVGADQWPFPGAVPVQEKARQNAYC